MNQIVRNADNSVAVTTVGSDGVTHVHTFKKRRVFLPDEEAAIQELLNRPNTIRIGMTGYSSIKEKDCLEWGVKVGAYEAACATLLRKVTMRVREQFPGASVLFTHGASDMGIDRVVINTAAAMNVPSVGFNCIEWAQFVPDEANFPVYIAADTSSYSDAFIRNLDVLINAGGRVQALEHDLLAAVKYNKKLILTNVLKAISAHNGPPARDETGRIINATAAFEESLYIQSAVSRAQRTDKFGELQNYVFEVIDHVSRQLLEPEIAFAN